MGLTLRYTLHRWRRLMNASYAEMRDTPIDVILADLDYIDIEQQYRSSQ